MQIVILNKVFNDDTRFELDWIKAYAEYKFQFLLIPLWP